MCNRGDDAPFKYARTSDSFRPVIARTVLVSRGSSHIHQRLAAGYRPVPINACFAVVLMLMRAATAASAPRQGWERSSGIAIGRARHATGRYRDTSAMRPKGVRLSAP